MSSSNSTHDSHQPHITPMWVYFGVLGALLILTVVTVAVAQVDLGPLNLPVAMAVATVKAGLVALIFMHLVFDHKFYIYLLLASLVFLAVFVIFCLFDLTRRHEIRHEVAAPIHAEAEWYKELRIQAAGLDHGEDHGDSHGELHGAKTNAHSEKHAPVQTPAAPQH